MSLSTQFSANKKRVGIWMLPILLLTLVWACSGEEGKGVDDPQFCKCIQVTDKLNKFSAELLERQATEKDVKTMKKLKGARDKECTRYYKMSGEDMLKRKESCK